MPDTVTCACRVLAHLDSGGLNEEDATTLRFLAQAQALLQASAAEPAARQRWEAFSRLSGRSKECSELHRRLSAGTAAANASSGAGACPASAE